MLGKKVCGVHIPCRTKSGRQAIRQTWSELFWRGPFAPVGGGSVVAANLALGALGQRALAGVAERRTRGAPLPAKAENKITTLF